MYEVRIRGTSNSKINPDTQIDGEYSLAKRICLRPNCEKSPLAAELPDEGYSIGFIVACICGVCATLLTIAAFVLWR